MKIVIFTDTFLPNTNGVVSATLNHIKELARRGNKILVLTIGKQREDYILEKNIRVIKYKGITIPTYKDYQFRIPNFKQTKKELENFKPEVIHAQTPFTMGINAVLNSRDLKIPLVSTHHTFFSDYVKHIFFFDFKLARFISDWYVKYFFNKCDYVTSPSLSLLKELKKIGVNSKTIKIQNGIFINNNVHKKNFKSEYKIKKSVLYMGRVSYEKSIDVVIRSMVKVQKKIPEAKLLIVGEGPDLENLKNLAKELNVDCIFTGIKRGQELVDHIYAGDVFVTASKSENQPMSILEAMSCKKSFVGVNSKGVPELIQNNKNGFIVKPDDSNQIASKIISLLKNPSLRKKFGENSFKEVKNYSIENVTDIWENFYQEISLNKPKRFK